MRENKKYEWEDWPESDRCDRVEHYFYKDCPFCDERGLRRTIESERKPTLLDKIKRCFTVIR